MEIVKKVTADGKHVEIKPLWNGKRHGLHQSFSEGRLYQFAEMIDNTGENWDYYEFHSTGGLSFRMPMRNGKRNGICKCWNEDGVLILQDEWKDDNRTGLVTAWYSNGQKKYEAMYKDDEMDGECTKWNEKGDIISKTMYKMGNAQ
jgi:antitoxin component YwqK of YwqJK toxin-antitoxin module